MSVQTHLTQTASNLILTPSEKLSISSSITILESRLIYHFSNGEINKKLLFGSYTRETILPRKVDPDSDIDYMIVFNNPSDLKPQTFLERLKRFTEARYSSSERKQSYPTIVLELNHIKFELVPAINSYWQSEYRIPNRETYDQWIDTSPEQLKRELTNKNIQLNYLGKPLVRLLKYWNTREGKIYSSFEIEKFVISNVFYSSSTLKELFFEAIRDLHSNRWSLPRYKISKVERAMTIVENTERFENNFQPNSAEIEIKKLIPSYFG